MLTVVNSKKEVTIYPAGTEEWKKKMESQPKEVLILMLEMVSKSLDQKKKEIALLKLNTIK